MKSVLFVVLVFCYASGQLPESPCPKVFTYEYDYATKRWAGKIRVYSPPSGSIQIDGNFTLAAALQNKKKFGSISLVGTSAEVYEQLDQGKGLTLRVNFPLESPLLRVTAIQVNNRVICVGAGDVGFKTNIRLSLTLMLEAAKPVVRPTLPPPIEESQSSAQPNRYAQYNCGKRINSITSLIVGGHNTTRGQWPWLVAFFLQRGSTFKFICGATLISSRVIVTAAHCVYDRELGRMLHPYEAVMSMGRNDVTKYNEVDAVSKNAEKLIMHEDFKYDSDTINDADIGLVILESEVMFNPFIQPICMWSESHRLSHIVGTKGIVAGWGRDEHNRQITPKAKWVEVPVVSDSDCLQSDLVYRYITSNRTFCAGTLNGEGPCTGDSGGGFVIQRGDQYVLRGVVSISIADPNKGCDEFKYLVFTDVSKYRLWIRSHTDRLG